MGIAKVIYGNNTLVDLTNDSVTAANLLNGVTAHAANGNPITGTYNPIDLSNDTVTPETLLNGYTAHNANGVPIVGTAEAGGSGDTKNVFDTFFNPTFTIAYTLNNFTNFFNSSGSAVNTYQARSAMAAINNLPRGSYADILLVLDPKISDPLEYNFTNGFNFSMLYGNLYKVNSVAITYKNMPFANTINHLNSPVMNFTRFINSVAPSYSGNHGFNGTFDYCKDAPLIYNVSKITATQAPIYYSDSANGKYISYNFPKLVLYNANMVSPIYNPSVNYTSLSKGNSAPFMIGTSFELYMADIDFGYLRLGRYSNDAELLVYDNSMDRNIYWAYNFMDDIYCRNDGSGKVYSASECNYRFFASWDMASNAYKKAIRKSLYLSPAINLATITANNTIMRRLLGILAYNWTPVTNGYYNADYNCYVYNNYTPHESV